MVEKSDKKVYHRSDTFESRRSAFRGIKRILGIPVVNHPVETIRNQNSEAWKREGLRREKNKGLYIFRWLGKLFSIREDNGKFYVDQGPHFNYGRHGKKLKGHGFFPKKNKKRK
jgi:hypothetical protein